MGIYDPGVSDTDFIGFTFNGVHSSSYNICKVSDGSRFNESLLPEFTDTTQARNGSDGTYFFGKNFSKRTIECNIAYDSVTEENLRDMRNWLNTDNPAPLIFDEEPYKLYYAKLNSQPNLSYICFLENGSRIYRGEGVISFVIYDVYAYEPFTLNTKQVTSAISSNTLNIKYKNYFKYLQNYSQTNKSEWSAASHMLVEPKETIGSMEYVLDSYQGTTNGYIDIYNAGDASVPFKLYLKRNLGKTSAGYLINCTEIKLSTMNDTRSSSTQVGIIKLNPTVTASESSEFTSEYFVFNSNNRLIEGYDSSNQKTGEVLNQFISSGDFFLIPPGKSRLNFNCGSDAIIMFECPHYYI